MSKLVIHVGGGFADDARRILAAVERAERDEHVEPESHVSFENWPTFFHVLTPGRVEVLRRVHDEAPRSVRALAHALRRDYRRVHEDVAALVAAGLIERQGTALSTDWDGDQADIEAA
ncbi:MAG: hypothetical protein ABI224_04065 [Acetobacteraceae bacterium]